jgi:hypothetical protein
MAATTTDIEAYFDVVELVQTQASATATYADATHSDGYTSAEENAIAYSKTTAASGSTVRQTVSYVFPAKVNVLNGYPTLGTGEGVTMTIIQGAAQTSAQNVKGTPATLTTVDGLIAAISADTSFGSGITLSAARDSYAQSINLLSYTDEAGLAETTASVGAITWKLGSTYTESTDIGASKTAAQIAGLIATAMTGTAVDGVGYGAAASGAAIILTREITNTTYYDRGPNTSDFPDITFDLTNLTGTTIDLADDATTNSTGVNSSFFIGFTQTNINGLRVTVKNNSTSVVMGVTSMTGVAMNEAGSAFDTAGPGARTQDAPTLLVSGTTMPGNAAYSSGYSDISNVTAASTTAKNRISWLG